MFFFQTIKANSQNSTIYVNVKVYVDDPLLVSNSVSVTDAEDLIELTNDSILDTHNIRLNACVVVLDTDKFDLNPDSFLSKFCSDYDDPQRLDIYLRTTGFNGIAGEARNRRVWSVADRFTFPHELGHQLGLDRHTDDGDGLCLSDSIDIDRIDDTPFHPNLYDSQNNGLPVFNGCTVNWLNVTDDCDELIIHPDSASVLLPLYINNIEHNLMAQVYPPNCDINTLPMKGFTVGQGNFMYNYILSLYQAYTSSTPLECGESSWTIIDSDINTDKTLSGYVVFENSVDINANVTFDSAFVVLRSFVSLNFKNGTNTIFDDSKVRYKDCGLGFSGSITFEDNSDYNISMTSFSDINQGIIFESIGEISNVSFSSIGQFSNGITIRDLGNLGQVNNTFILTDIIASASNINITNSRVALWGPEVVGGSTVEITDGEFFTQMSPAPRKPVFGPSSKLIFNSGNQLVIDNASFDTNNNNSGVTVRDCQNLMICRSQFLGSNTNINSIELIRVTESAIFENVFTGSTSTGIISLDSPDGLVRNNIFEDTQTSLEYRTSAAEVEISCNFHENNNTAWLLSSGVVLDTQGMVGVPAYNNFINTTKHVTNNVEFIYHYDPLNPNVLDFYLADEIDPEQTLPNFANNPNSDVCISRNEIIGDWATWLGCPLEDIDRVSLTCAHTGCTYHIPPPVPPRLKDLGSKSSSNQGALITNRIESIASLTSSISHENVLDIKNYYQDNSEITIYPNPFDDFLIVENSIQETLKIYVYDSLGRLVLTTNIGLDQNKIDLSEVVSGLLIVEVLSKSGIRLNQRIIKK